MEKVEIKIIKLKDLEPNKGQLEGLPTNPRFIKDKKFKETVKSLEDNPEMLSLREFLVYPLDNGKYIIIGGNQRYRALKELHYKEVPCKVIPKSATIDQLKAYTIKDNAQYGQWDMNMLANEWDAEQLGSWGLEVMEGWSDDVPEQDLEGKSKEIDVLGYDEDMTLSVSFTKDQLDWVRSHLMDVDQQPSIALLKIAGFYETNDYLKF